jgi:hypothetical protein
MVVIERLTAAEIQSRSPPFRSRLPHETTIDINECFGCLSTRSPSASSRPSLSSAVSKLTSPMTIPFYTSLVATLLHTLDVPPYQLFASFNLHSVRRNHGRLRSNGFIEGAPEQRAKQTPPEYAPPIEH